MTKKEREILNHLRNHNARLSGRYLALVGPAIRSGDQNALYQAWSLRAMHKGAAAALAYATDLLEVNAIVIGEA